MKNLETIVLRYNNSNRIEYQYYAEFLRLLGIYVWEFLEESPSKKPGREPGFGDALVLDVKDLLLELDIEEQPHSWHYLYRSLRNRLFMKMSYLDSKWNVSELRTVFPMVSAAYQRYNLLIAATTLQYYRKIDPKVESAAGCFENARVYLEKRARNAQRYLNNRYLRYAILYCKQKANLGRKLCRQPLSEMTSILAGECLGLAEEFPDFSNAWVLRGLSYETTDKHSREAVEAFNNAAQKVRDYPYVSSIYYWIGKRCEGYDAPHFKALTEAAYKIAYKIDPKYRICYKMAIMMERKSDWEMADRYYRECMEYMSCKNDYLDPLEQEYYFKAAIRAAYNSLAHLEDAEKAIDLLKSAKSLRDDIEAGRDAANWYTRFYFDLYDYEAPDYIDLELSRMGTVQLYQYLAKAYQIMDAQREYRVYRDLFERELSRTNSNRVNGLKESQS